VTPATQADKSGGSPQRVLVTGGSGFVGANLAVALARRHPSWEVLGFDNLRRRGSELNVPRLRGAGVEFVHGDIREPSDLLELDRVDAIVECSAEPSVLAGLEGGTAYPVQTNLIGAFNALELAKRDRAQLVFLSTSRVYPVGALTALRYEEDDTRLRLTEQDGLPGVSPAGISEAFPLAGARTLYGATKLAAELLIAEYAASFGLSCVVNRCGVIAGPWQMGKVDQGVFTHWMLAHYFRRPLAYIGFGGHGKQVRDLLHVDDLVDLMEEQLTRPDHWSGRTFNVGGGGDCSLSLVETTRMCGELTGHQIEVGSVAETRPGDVPIYVSDCSAIYEHAEWRPRRSREEVLRDILEWIEENEQLLKGLLT
jgi:CDP-paratose 2-epimerase